MSKRLSQILGASDDLLVAQIALEAGLLTQRQLEECLAEEAQAPHEPLESIMLRKGLVSAERLQSLKSQEATRLLQLATERFSPRFVCLSCGSSWSLAAARDEREYRCESCQQLLVPITGEPTRLEGPAAPTVQADAKRLSDEVREQIAKPGSKFGKFVKLSWLGEGASGSVWRCYDTELDRSVAVKVLTGANPTQVKRFVREAQLAARLRHPHIVVVHEVGEREEIHYIVMDCIDGESSEKADLKPRQAVEVVAKIADAVDYAHREGIIHRDIKPENIMIDGRGQPYLLDFGLARVQNVPSTLSVEGLVAGTPSYTSPEQAMGMVSKINFRTDIYSLGATLYALLAGRPPFEGTNPFKVLSKVVRQEPPALRRVVPGISKKLESIVRMAMEKDPALRYASAAEFRDDLLAFLEGRPIQSASPGWPQRWERLLDRARRHGKKLALGVGALALASLAALLLEYLLVVRPKEAEANRMVDEAAAAIDRWEIHLYGNPIELRQKHGELEESMRKLDKALSTHPASARALYYKARCLYYMWDHTRALELLDQAVRLDETGPALLLRATVYQVLYLNAKFNQLAGGAQSAVEIRNMEEFRKALVHDLERVRIVRGLKPREESYAGAALAFGDERYDQAIHLAQEILAKDPNDADAIELIANATLFRDTPDYQRAIELLERALQIRRSSHRLRLELAVACRLAAAQAGTQDDKSGAVRFLERAEKACQDGLEIAKNGRAYAALAETRILLARHLEGEQAVGHLERALAALQLGMSIDPSEPLLYVDAGTAHYQLAESLGGDKEKARSHKQSATEFWEKAISLDATYVPVLAPFLQRLRDELVDPQ